MGCLQPARGRSAVSTQHNSAAATMMNPSASSSRNQFATGTSATLPVLERNREMAKLQKTESFVAQIVLAECGPACVMSAGGTCHRSGDVPPVLLLHVHTFFHLPCSQTSVTRLACRSTRAPVAHGSVDVSRKIEVGAHSVDSYNSYAIYFE